MEPVASKPRARLYREHKYVFFVFSNLVQFVGALDFSEINTVKQVKERMQKLKLLLESHAYYEESRIHSLLKERCTLLFQKAELEYNSYVLFFEKAEKRLMDIENRQNQEDKNYLGNLYEKERNKLEEVLSVEG